MSFRLAVSAEMVFTELPFMERVRRIDELGFEVEIWDWTKKDIAALVEDRGHVLVDDRVYHRHPGRRRTAPTNCSAPPSSP